MYKVLIFAQILSSPKKTSLELLYEAIWKIRKTKMQANALLSSYNALNNFVGEDSTL